MNYSQLLLLNLIFQYVKKRLLYYNLKQLNVV
ncbi:hypothetical protein SL72_03127 [Klebsiella pneumoniae]|nr:hypothetical protein SL72_03127 [Klebsiella pneumoniae]